MAQEEKERHENEAENGKRDVHAQHQHQYQSNGNGIAECLTHGIRHHIFYPVHVIGEVGKDVAGVLACIETQRNPLETSVDSHAQIVHDALAQNDIQIGFRDPDDATQRWDREEQKSEECKQQSISLRKSLIDQQLKELRGKNSKKIHRKNGEQREEAEIPIGTKQGEETT